MLAWLSRLWRAIKKAYKNEVRLELEREFEALNGILGRYRKREWIDEEKEDLLNKREAFIEESEKRIDETRKLNLRRRETI